MHRTQFPWIGFLQSTVMEDIVLSMLQVYDQVGFLPKWPFAYGETGSMTGNHADIIISEAFLKKELPSQKIDIRKAFRAMKETSNNQVNYVGRYNPADYIKRGYVPSDFDHVGACLTLEYSYDDGCIAQVAKVLNETADYLNFTQRSQNYRNVWNSEYQFFCPKTSTGKWNCPEIWADSWDSRYVEGDAWHYRFYVPHDVEGLVQLFGKDKFLTQLEEFAYRSTFFKITAVPNPWYWGGNEHNLMSLWLFNYVDRPDLTQHYVRYMLDNLYLNDPSGLPGNNDYGTMSAWFVWASIGLYPRAGSTEYFVGSPLFEDIVVNRENACPLHIQAFNYSPEKYYVDRVVLNGKTLTRAFINHSDLDCRSSNTNTIQLQFYMK